ncbi:serine hydrolase domain-containing protein [Lentzea aerocolonigenes]|uniref:serine hydrolase domain-containing protein n=1 Tax=Lentzea aerocolonigenes TaxID=68170 RepID=UPI00055EC39A|nr:serine hydrolase domain-containing protein [Lentzea aerocolonigenes]MCP2242537.1 D-alanyl-D-alanine carboxypeptidase [Lentzea aerocolonigenes]
MKAELEAIHRAGVPGVWAEVRENGEVWRGAAGDVTPDVRHRIGSVTKTFTAAAIMQLVERGKIGLDTPVHGDATVRTLLNMTSGLADYRFLAFPSLLEGSPQSLEDNQFRHFYPRELIKLGVDAPAVPPGTYSNTGYLLLGRLIEKVTGTTAERWITRHVIERAGLHNTMFPTGTRIEGPHPPMFEALFGLLDPPRDYSVYDMSWVGVSASLISTVEDLNLFFSALLDGKVVSRKSLAEMQKTGPVVAFDGSTVEYGLGLHRHGEFWGHDGSVWGAGTWSFHSADGRRQVTLAINLQRWNDPAIDEALKAFQQKALCQL